MECTWVYDVTQLGTGGSNLCTLYGYGLYDIDSFKVRGTTCAQLPIDAGLPLQVEEGIQCFERTGVR